MIDQFLAEEIRNIIEECQDNRKVEIVPWTGEMLDVRSLELARLYQSAPPLQRAAFDAVANLVAMKE